ncbi:MAG: NblA/ycf18 family protein [Prochloraceae cyanobacterium]|nr:NblA/ycf18 family protein [Prochloraceae cyanobacterium]
MNLSLEQEFQKRVFAERVQELSKEQAQELAIELYKQIMLKENMYKDFIKNELGFGHSRKKSGQ